MQKLAVFVLISGILALGSVLGLRYLGRASASAALTIPPGEGRLDQPGDVFAGLFRSWSLGGQETNNNAQEEAFLRLGTVRGSKLVRLELRRRELETMIAAAQAALERVRATRTEAAAGEDLWESGEEYSSVEGMEGAAYTETENAPPAEEDQAPPAAHVADTAMTQAEAEARDTLAGLEQEYESILAGLAPAALAREKERVAEIAVLAGGAARGVQALLARWGQPFRVVEPGPGLAALGKTQPVLVIPSGAMDRGAGGQIASFVRGGGTVISFAQRSGAELRALPGGPRGFGWAETESAFDEAVEVAAAHPSTVSCQKTRFSAAIDGFFTQTPAHSETLLRAAANGRPVAISYPIGKGRVIATTLYTDWAAMTRPPGGTEYLMLRDLMLWALAAGRRLHPGLVTPGAKIEVTLPIVNDAPEMAKKVRVCYLTPEGAYGKPFELDLRVLPKEHERRVVHVHAPGTPGIWHLAYALVRPDGSLLQYWRNAVDLAVGSPAVAPNPSGVGASVTCPGEVLRAGRELALTVNLWNYDKTAARVTCTGPSGTESVTVAAGDDRKLVCRIPADGRAAARGYYEFALKGGFGAARLAKFITAAPSGGKGHAQ